MYKVKVLLATYNGKNFIVEQVNSIKSQEGIVVDIVCGDDSSKDATVDILHNKFPELEITINNPGTGSAARNFLRLLEKLDFCEDFEYVAFADQDDIWLPNKLSKAVESLSNTSSSLYCSNLTKWDMLSGEYSLLKKDFKEERFDFLFEGGSAGCTYVMDKVLALKIVMMLKDVDYMNWKGLSHDWLVYFYARLMKFKVFIDKESYIHYRLHGNNVHGHLNKLSFKTIQDKFSQVLNGYHQEAAKQFIQLVPIDSEEYSIYKDFIGGYWKRNKMIWKYNTALMRDKKKLIAFMFLNLIRIK